MLEEGKITREEAGRLHAAINAEQQTAKTAPEQSVRRADPGRRRLLILLAFGALFFALGVIGGGFWLQPAPPGDLPVNQNTTAKSSGRSESRLIDPQALEQERSTTMGNAKFLSYSIFAIATAAVMGIAILLIYNSLVDAREKVNAGWAQVENQYQRRLDLVPVLIDGVETYIQHERETLTALTEARASALGAASTLAGNPPETEQQLRALEASQGKVQAALTRLFAVVENYPNLKASQNFLALQDQIEGTENRIAVERRNYNEWSRRYNTRMQKFPSNVIADALGFTAKPYFQAQTAALESLPDPFGRDPQ